eukprot:m51a1_g3358 hypothetical protein (436) ;mRNA; f:434069-435634
MITELGLAFGLGMAVAYTTVAGDEARSWVRIHDTRPANVVEGLSGERVFASLSRDGRWTVYDGAAKRQKDIGVEGIEVELAQVHRTPWHRANSIRLAHPWKLPNGRPEAFLSFETAKELEKWLQLLRAFSRQGGAAALEAERFKYKADFYRVPKKGNCSQALTALVHRLWYMFHADQTVNAALRALIDEKLAFVIEDVKPKLSPSIEIELRVARLDIGPNMPIVHSATLVSFSRQGDLDIDADIEYAGGLLLAVQSVVCVTILCQRVEVPVAVSVRVRGGKGRARVSAHAPPSRCLWIGFHDVPDFDIEIDTRIGRRTQVSLASLPDALFDSIIGKIRAEIADIFVLPNMEDIALPDIDSIKNKSSMASSPQVPEKKPDVPIKDIAGSPVSCVGESLGRLSESSKLCRREESAPDCTQKVKHRCPVRCNSDSKKL